MLFIRALLHSTVIKITQHSLNFSMSGLVNAEIKVQL